MQQQVFASDVEVKSQIPSSSSTGSITSNAPSESGTKPSGKRKKVRRYKLRKSLIAEQVEQIQRLLGLGPDDFEEVKERKKSPDEPKAQDMAAFWMFWRLYPRHDIVGAAMKAWRSLQPDSDTVEKIVRDVQRRCQSFEWKKDGGKWIPYAHTYLSGQRWLDEGVVGQSAPRKGVVV